MANPKSSANRAQAPAAAAPDALALEREFGWAVYDVQRLIGRIFDRRMKELGLTQAQGRVLATLKREDGLTQTEIADILDMERAPLGKLVDRLEDAGFIERRADGADRRVRRVFLLPRSASVAAEMEVLGADIFDVALEGVSRRTLEQVTAALVAMKSNLMAHEAARTAVSPVEAAAE